MIVQLITFDPPIVLKSTDACTVSYERDGETGQVKLKGFQIHEIAQEPKPVVMHADSVCNGDGRGT